MVFWPGCLCISVVKANLRFLLASGGRGASATAFQLALTGRAPGGRGRVRLAWQVAPVGTPFTATTVLSGTTAWTDTLTAGVPLTQGVSGLSAGTAYHWRARLEYPAAAGQRAGRWLPPAGLAAPALRTATGATVVTRTLTYAYDPLGRLVGATYSTGEAYAYQYDAAGNRTALTETTPLSGTTVTTYTYDAAHRLTSAGGVPYTWDARGNLTSDGVFTYTYSAAGQLVRAQSGNATLVYTYTADGLRVAQSSNGVVTTFAWDWATPVPELLSSGATRYLLGAETLGQWDGAAWAYVLPDALGSVRQTVDGAGAVTADREWSPYGAEVGGAQAGLGYTGEWQDADVGLVYLRARWYQAETGRFTQRDPVATSTFYRYASGNPINYVDPTGYFSEGLIQRSVYPASLAELVALFSPDPSVAWGQLAAPYDSPDAIYFHDYLVRPELSGLLWLLKHAGMGDRLRSGRLVRKGWNLEIEWTPEWTLTKSDGCGSEDDELLLTRERGWLGNLIFGPYTKKLRDYINEIASQNTILSGYVFHELNGDWGNEKVIDGYSPVPDLLTVDGGLSAPIGDVGGTTSVSVDRYGTQYASAGGSYGVGGPLPVSADVGAVYVGDFYSSLVDVMHRKESKALPEQISDFWRGWSTGASVQMFWGGGWLLADNGKTGTIFTSGLLNIGVGGARGFTEYKQELFTSGWDTLDEGFRAISWEDALIEPAYPAAGE